MSAEMRAQKVPVTERIEHSLPQGKKRLRPALEGPAVKYPPEEIAEAYSALDWLGRLIPRARSDSDQPLRVQASSIHRETHPEGTGLPIGLSSTAVGSRIASDRPLWPQV